MRSCRPTAQARLPLRSPSRPALPAAGAEWLAGRYRLPEPRLELAAALKAFASAAADVSDGLVADAGHIGEASGVRVRIELDRLPVSEPASAWLSSQPDRPAALAQLATGGDDYEVVCACPPEKAAALIAAAEAAGVAMTDVGEVAAGEGAEALLAGRPIRLAHTGWRHG